MGGMRGDLLARAFGRVATRRTAVALLALLGLDQGPLLPSGVAGKRRHGRRRHGRKKCEKKCGLCNRCKRGRCRLTKPNGTACALCSRCQGGRCVSDCQEGQACSGGQCADAPTCRARDAFCTAPGECCSGRCMDEDGNGVPSCACSATGQPCLLTGDCCEGNCMAFVCVERNASAGRDA